MGREKFLERVWKWKEESGDAIVRQQKRLGLTPDWDRQRFTMDDGLSAAVRKIFVRLYKDGLIYRNKRLVNWDPKLLTAVSDLEVDNVECQGNLWYIVYDIANDPSRTITVATTRPETLFGDTGIAVHPDDERYKDLIGKKAIVPFVNREIPIVADEHSDPEKGTGAVKITPAHDFNDFEVGERHNLEKITILDEHGSLTTDLPKPFAGLERFTARKRVVQELEALGKIKKIEQTAHSVPHGERSGVVLEPRLTDQWFVNAEPLAKEALAAAHDGRTTIYPESGFTLTIIGLKTFNLGVFHGNCGGDIKFPLGLVPITQFLSPKPKKKPKPKPTLTMEKPLKSPEKQMFLTLGFLRHYGLFQPSAGLKKQRNLTGFTQQTVS